MEDRSGDTIQTMEEKPMSVAALASKFKQEQSNHLEKSEKHLKGPVRKKPPCFLHLDAPKNNTETGHNADEKPSVNDSTHRPKLKLKTSSPLIEKLQANLLLSPHALVPGAAPKSPLKSCFSPFASPASTPDSPGARSQSSESDGVALDQPTEGEPLHSFHKSRARVSLKRRPPSRRFRHSVAEESSNPGSPETETPAKNVEPKENGAPGDENEDVFTEHGVQSNGENPKSPTSPKGDAHTSPKASSPEEPSHKELSSPQSQESEICPDPNQCEQIEDNDMATNKTDESPSEDSDATVSNDHHTAASETAGPETSNQEPKTEEVKVIETEQQISSTEEKSSGGTED
ncbi:capZ-interacting protein-like isoform X2 [Scyliorhinus canicula]|uniref:capZ-interacting protein-like isoform X2 n=1 Tax=Scyliorhinus canicula TaxID=7830 RepID=UPI0018F4D0FF|nr:capZ-interacting protein-like isoform X2 [Scyliorhinus canicula]